MVDHTLLKPEATPADVQALIADAERLGAWSVCVSPSMLPIETSVKVAVVCGFPSGKHTSAVKAAEAAESVRLGADEIDMVIDVGAAVADDVDAIEADVAAVRAACEGAVLKVIIESAALTDEQVVGACQAAEAAGADFVKTSTGFHPSGGATAHAVRLMRETVEIAWGQGLRRDPHRRGRARDDRGGGDAPGAVRNRGRPRRVDRAGRVARRRRHRQGRGCGAAWRRGPARRRAGTTIIWVGLPVLVAGTARPAVLRPGAAVVGHRRGGPPAQGPGERRRRLPRRAGAGARRETVVDAPGCAAPRAAAAAGGGGIAAAAPAGGAGAHGRRRHRRVRAGLTRPTCRPVDGPGVVDPDR